MTGNLPRASELEIVGFNGAPVVGCGRALPVVRRTTDAQYCVLDIDGARQPAWSTEAEALEFARQQRWTRLTKPLNLPQGCVAGATGAVVTGPMVVFVDEAVVDTADQVALPEAWENEYLLWRRLEGSPTTLWAAAAPAGTVESLLESWAEALMKRFDALFSGDTDRRRSKRIADLALCAARSPERRWLAYQRYAMALEPDRVRRTFDTFTQREFPQANWEKFLSAVGSLKQVLTVVPQQPPPPAVPAARPAATKFPGLAAKTALDLVESNHR